MTFTTVTYLLFLGVVFAAYWGLRRRRAQNLLLILASYGFYAWWDWRYCGLMLLSTIVDYAAGRGIARAGRRIQGVEGARVVAPAPVVVVPERQVRLGELRLQREGAVHGFAGPLQSLVAAIEAVVDHTRVHRR